MWVSYYYNSKIVTTQVPVRLRAPDALGIALGCLSGRIPSGNERIAAEQAGQCVHGTDGIFACC